ncbi:MAG: N-acetylmuramoyl-L-alanine amidase [Desulfotomaculales bacterium]
MPAPVIVLDPGHGGPDPGAAAHGLREADLTLALALACARHLASVRAAVRLTRTADRDVSLAARVAAANPRADLFLSLHCNAARAPEARGFESYVHPAAGPCTRALRRLIHTACAAYLAGHGVPDRGMKQADLYVLRKTVCPAVLLECLFVTNPEDAQLLADPEWRAALGREIARAVTLAVGLAG